MRIVAIALRDLDDPVEVQDWFNAHPLAIINSVCVVNNVVYIIYT